MTTNTISLDYTHLTDQEYKNLNKLQITISKPTLLLQFDETARKRLLQLKQYLKVETTEEVLEKALTLLSIAIEKQKAGYELVQTSFLKRK